MIYKTYYKEILKQLDRQVVEEGKNIEKAADYCADSIINDRVIHVFGGGHSQMFAMEVFYRSGGLVPINSLLIPHIGLHPIARLSTYQERLEGFSNEYLKLENTDEKDTMIIVSVSGRNSTAVDMGIEAKRIGMKVVAITSVDFSDSVSSRHSTGNKLKDVADVVIDLKCEIGDAVLSLDGVPDKFAATSSVLGMAVMEMIVGQTVENCVNRGITPPIFVSANLDRGDEINAGHIKKYSPIIRNL